MSARALADLTTGEVGRRPSVLVPLGSLEQHGPHLPLDTDAAIATAVAGRLAELLAERAGCAGAGEVLVAPVVVYGSSGEHQSFPGTVSVGAEALRVIVVELVRSLRTWAGRVVLVNGHGGNLPPLDDAVAQLLAEGHDVVRVSCATEDVDLHAGRTETSLMLHLRPGAVRLDLVEVGDLRPLTEILVLMREGGVAAVSANGVLGDPRGASAGEGAEILERMARLALRALSARAGSSGPTVSA